MNDIITAIIVTYIWGGFILGFLGSIIMSEKLIMIIPYTILAVILSPLTPTIVLICKILNIFGHRTWLQVVIDKYNKDVSETKMMKDILDSDIKQAKSDLEKVEEKIKKNNRYIFWAKTIQRICIAIILFIIFRMMFRK